MPTFEFQCRECEYIFEDLILAGDEFPKDCPECEAQNCLQKLISAPALGKVALYGQDFKNQMQKEANKAMKDSQTNENLLANLVGETKYERKTKEYEKDKQNRPKIKSSGRK